MANRHSKSKARPRRNSSTKTKRPSSVKLSGAIEAERRQLQKVDAVLNCIAIAYDAGTPVCYLDIPDAIEAARSLLGDCVSRLDSVNILRSRPAEE